MGVTSNLSATHSHTESSSSTLSHGLWITAFALATVVGARVEIPHHPIPFTLQTMVVLLAGAFLGARNGAVSQVAYLSLGAVGLPVFAGAGAGFTTLLGPTGGYLLAFPVAAAVVGYLLRNAKSLPWVLFSMASGLLVIFACGTLQLYAVYFQDWAKAFAAGFLIFSWWDLIKLFAAAMTYHQLAKRWARLP